MLNKNKTRRSKSEIKVGRRRFGKNAYLSLEIVITVQRRRIQAVVKPVKVRIDTRLKANGLHTVAKSLRNLSELILAEIRIL